MPPALPPHSAMLHRSNRQHQPTATLGLSSKDKALACDASNPRDSNAARHHHDRPHSSLTIITTIIIIIIIVNIVIIIIINFPAVV